MTPPNELTLNVLNGAIIWLSGANSHLASVGLDCLVGLGGEAISLNPVFILGSVSQKSKQNGHIGLTGFGHKACADWSNTLVRFVCILLMLTSNTVKVLSSYLQLMNFFASLP